MLPQEIEICILEEFPSRAEGIRFLLGCSGAQLKKAELPKKWLEQKNRPQELWRLPIDLVNFGKIFYLYEGPEIFVLKESKDFLAIHKPAGIHSHPQRYSDTNTAVNALISIGREELLEVNSLHYDRSLLYRLDFETSGVVIFAKSDDIYKSIRENFSGVAKDKTYLAIVSGKFNKEGTWTHYLKSSGPGGERQKVSDQDPTGQRAELSVKLVDYSEDKNLSLIKISLKTGLRHQIRAQLSHLGFPLLGDEFYGGAKSMRLYLHAFEYRLELGNEIFEVRDEIAELFESFFDLHCAL